MNLIANLLPLSNIMLDTDLTSKKRVFEQAGLLFENHQQADGSIRIPEALRPFVGGIAEIRRG